MHNFKAFILILILHANVAWYKKINEMRKSTLNFSSALCRTHSPYQWNIINNIFSLCPLSYSLRSSFLYADFFMFLCSLFWICKCWLNDFFSFIQRHEITVSFCGFWGFAAMLSLLLPDFDLFLFFSFVQFSVVCRLVSFLCAEKLDLIMFFN